MPLTFRDDQQRTLVAATLCRRAGQPHLWSEDGPTDFCRELISTAGAQLDGRQRTVLYLALALCGGLGGWPREAAVTLENLLSLDAVGLEAIGELLASALEGAEGINWWLRSYAKE